MTIPVDGEMVDDVHALGRLAHGAPIRHAPSQIVGAQTDELQPRAVVALEATSLDVEDPY